MRGGRVHVLCSVRTDHAYGTTHLEGIKEGGPGGLWLWLWLWLRLQRRRGPLSQALVVGGGVLGLGVGLPYQLLQDGRHAALMMGTPTDPSPPLHICLVRWRVMF